MRARLGRWNAGDPPSLVIEADTLDDTKILEAVAEGQNTHRLVLGGGWACYPPAPGKLHGQTEISFSWFKKDIEPAAMTVEEMVKRGVDREDAEFVHGEQWPANTFEPIGEVAKRVMKKLE